MFNIRYYDDSKGHDCVLAVPARCVVSIAAIFEKAKQNFLVYPIGGLPIDQQAFGCGNYVYWQTDPKVVFKEINNHQSK